MKTLQLATGKLFGNAVLLSLFTTLIPSVIRADQVLMTVTGKVLQGTDGMRGQARVFGGPDTLAGQPFTLIFRFDDSQGTNQFPPPFKGSILNSSNTGRAVASGPSIVLQIGGGSFTYGALPGSLNWSIYRYSGVPIDGNSSFSSSWTEDYTGDHSGGGFIDRLWFVPVIPFDSGDWRSPVSPVIVSGSWISFNISISEAITPTANPALLKYATGQLIPETFSVGRQSCSTPDVIGLNAVFGTSDNLSYGYDLASVASNGTFPACIRSCNHTGHLWFEGPAIGGHKYLALNSLGKSSLSAQDVMAVIKKNITTIFPYGAKGLDGPEVAIDRRFIVTWDLVLGESGYSNVKCTDDTSYHFTFTTIPGEHILRGYITFGVLKDACGELWLFQQGRGPADEGEGRAILNYTTAKYLWEKMADNVTKALE